MSCVICHDSIFAAQAEAGGAQGPRTRAAALSCGHFDTSAQSVCPTCQNEHIGDALSLFIDYDETEAQRTAEDQTSAEEAAEEDEAELRSLRTTARDLTLRLAQTTDMAQQMLQAASNQQRVHNERLYELEEKDEEIDRLKTELNESHEENEKVGEQRERIDELEGLNPEWLQSEVNRLEQLAVSHAANISGVNRKIRDQAARISNLEFDNNSDWLQSEVDRLEQLAVSHTSNINGMNRKIRDQAAQISDLEFDNNELCRVSDAHRTHIKSLQSAVRSQKNMLDGYGYY
ncbi:hypothetical protein GGH96_005255 [Coemansia sp. RSA 1972]|nr:hypothetical protein GGH96_005255 [Coemansia sp. RSA 1972]